MLLYYYRKNKIILLSNLSKRIFEIKGNIEIIGSNSKIKFITPYTPYQTLILGIKIQRIYDSLSMDIGFDTSFWHSNEYNISIENITDITIATMIAYKIY